MIHQMTKSIMKKIRGGLRETEGQVQGDEGRLPFYRGWSGYVP